MWYAPHLLPPSEPAAQQLVAFLYSPTSTAAAQSSSSSALAALRLGSSAAAGGDWVRLRHRRLRNFGGSPGGGGDGSKSIRIPLPPILTAIGDTINGSVAHCRNRNANGDVVEGSDSHPGSSFALAEVIQRWLPCRAEADSSSPPIAASPSSLCRALSSPSSSLATTQASLSLSQVLPCAWNHVLVNEYSCPDGIHAHEDGPLYDPVVAIVSLLSTAPLVFTQKRLGGTMTTEEVMDAKKDEDQSLDVHHQCRRVAMILQPGSAFLFTDSFYSRYLHEMPQAMPAGAVPFQWSSFGYRVDCTTAAPATMATGSFYDDDDDVGSAVNGESTSLRALPDLLSFGDFLHVHEVANWHAIAQSGVVMHDAVEVDRALLGEGLIPYFLPLCQEGDSSGPRSFSSPSTTTPDDDDASSDKPHLVSVNRVEAARYIVLQGLCTCCSSSTSDVAGKNGVVAATGLPAVWIPRGAKRLSLTFRRVRPS